MRKRVQFKNTFLILLASIMVIPSTAGTATKMMSDAHGRILGIHTERTFNDPVKGFEEPVSFHITRYETSGEQIELARLSATDGGAITATSTNGLGTIAIGGWFRGQLNTETAVYKAPKNGAAFLITIDTWGHMNEPTLIDRKTYGSPMSIGPTQGNGFQVLAREPESGQLHQWFVDEFGSLEESATFELYAQETTSVSEQVIQPEDQTEGTGHVIQPEDQTEGTGRVIQPEDQTEGTSYVIQPEDQTENSGFVIQPEDQTEGTGYVIQPEDQTEGTSFVIQPEDQTENSSFVIQPEDQTEGTGYVIQPEDQTEGTGYVIQPEDQTEGA